MSCFVIAEAGVNHNGDESMALELVRAAVAAGADAVKFQTFRAEKLVSANAAKAAYQTRETGEGNQLSMLRALELSEQSHRRVMDCCRDNGIEFMSTAFDVESLAFLVELGIRRIKIPSGEITNYPLLEAMTAYGLPLILSTGMSTLDEVRDAVEVIQAAWKKHRHDGALADNLTVLHCTSNYPAALEEVNLRAMNTLARTLRLPVGYSDHTVGTLVAPLACAMGAVVVEKHFTLDRSLPGPDHKASLEPEELASMVGDIRNAEIALGSADKVPSAAELEVRAVARRSLTLARPVSAGAILRAEDIVILRPGDGIPPREFDNVVGRKTGAALDAGRTLQWDDLV